MTDPITELAIRAARAELERDAAIKRAEHAEEMLRQGVSAATISENKETQT